MPRNKGDIIKLESDICLSAVASAGKELIDFQNNNTKNLEKWIQFKPKTTIDDGIKSFISWYLSYYK